MGEESSQQARCSEHVNVTDSPISDRAHAAFDSSLTNRFAPIVASRITRTTYIGPCDISPILKFFMSRTNQFNQART